MQVVVCVMAKNENLYINDFVNHYLSIGFDKIYIYDNNELNDSYIGDFIDQKDKVEIIDIRGKKGHCYQHKVYTDFYKSHSFDWCLFCDVDEFLFGTRNIKHLLKMPMFKNCDQIRVKWKLFGDDDLIERDMSKPVYEIFKKPITETYKQGTNERDKLEYQAKCIVRGNVKYVTFASCHFAKYEYRLILSKTPCGDTCLGTNKVMTPYRSNIYLHHYMTKSLSEFVKQKLNRNDAVFCRDIPLDYYWRINKKTTEKIEYLKGLGLWDTK